MDIDGKVLTVVVPAYNAQKFLDKNIPCFLTEGLAGSIEVLIVDDGSTDDTFRTAKKYEDLYPNTVRVIKKKNGGHGSAVNTGIDNASGRYFMICDADDWIKSDSMERMVSWLADKDVDLLLTNAEVINENGKKTGTERVKGMPSDRIMKLDDCFGRLGNVEMHNFCVRTGFLLEKGIRCHEKLFYVDNEFVVYSLLNADTVAYLDMVVYQYLVGRSGQSVSIQSRRKNYYQYVTVADYLIGYYKSVKEGISAQRREYIAEKIAYFVSGVYSLHMSYMDAAHLKQLKEFDEWLCKTDADVYSANRNVCVTILRKTNMAAYYVASFIYRIVNGL